MSSNEFTQILLISPIWVTLIEHDIHTIQINQKMFRKC